MDLPWPFKSRIPFAVRLRASMTWQNFWYCAGVVFRLHESELSWLDSLDLAWWVFWTMPEDYD